MTKYRLTYTLLGLALVAVSCSDEATPDANGNHPKRIEFSAALPQVTSRATEVSDTNLDKFQVSSFVIGSSSDTHYFLDRTFTRHAETGSYFSLDPECIWPNNNDLVRFTAFAPSCEDMRLAGGFGSEAFTLPVPGEGETVASSEYKISNFKVARDIADQFDFVTAIGSGNLLDNEDTPIDLNFNHQLSRIELKAWGASTMYNMEIAGVRFGGVANGGVFSFATPDETGTSPAGYWESVERGYVEYIFREGDRLVVLDKSAGSPASASDAVSILGKKVGEGDGYENSAMIIPSVNPAWDYKENAANGLNNAEGMYFSVLVRITDTTPYNPGAIVYPYAGNPEDMEVIYLAVDQNDPSAVKTRVYTDGDDYYTDPECTETYSLEANSAEVKAFGWAALPVADEWKPGYVYTYTLNYTNGVGLRNPRDPQPGKPIISDRVLINVTMSPWVSGGNSDITVPRR